MTIDIEDDDTDTSTVRARATMRAAVRRGAFPNVPAALTQAAEGFDRLDELERQVLGEAVTTPAAVLRQTVDALLTGAPVANFAGDVYEAAQAVARSTAAANTLQRLRAVLGDQFAAVVGEHLPVLLDGLRADLTEVLAELATVTAALDGLDVTDPNAVAESSDDQRAAMLALSGLGKRYVRIRSNQRTALVASDLKVPGSNNLTLHGWRDVFAAGVHEFRFGAGPATGSTTDRIRRLAGRTDVWVPTIEELDEAWATVAPSSLRGAS